MIENPHSIRLMANEDKLSLEEMSQDYNLSKPSLADQFKVDETNFTEISQLVERVIYTLPGEDGTAQSSNILGGRGNRKFMKDISTIFKGPLAPFNKVLIEEQWKGQVDFFGNVPDFLKLP